MREGGTAPIPSKAFRGIGTRRAVPPEAVSPIDPGPERPPLFTTAAGPL